MSEQQHPDPGATGAYDAAASTPAERFAPGAVLAGRYRIVAVLGKGGMGEVYRADDLTLGQPVALKFLPPHLADDPDRLIRFRKEVAVARKVSHPSCCRVYDLGEHAGQPFLSMEYIDGEDLISALRRFGRLPEERAVGVARELCQALQAVHDQGLLHRDLKPANVMLDGRGRVRLTDFGLTAVAEELSDADVRSGTPQYMAPEQLAGKEVTVRSDLFALGLVLYELFTGKKAYQGTERDTLPSKPTSHVSTLDPAVERVILRCLEREPAARPRSAAEVLAGLPGGDPLAAAVAAGETPSPRLVADAGEVGLIRPWVGLALLAFVAVAFVALARLYDTVEFRRVPLPKSPDVLADHARDILHRLGCTDRPADSAQGFLNDVPALWYAHRRDPAYLEGEPVRVGGPAPVYFFYRQGPAQLNPLFAGSGESLLVSDDNPPPTAPGMAGVMLDPAGHLLGFTAVPPDPDSRPPAAGAAWEEWFREAGLDMAGFRPDPAGPVLRPPAACTERLAWAEVAGGECRVEAGSDQGRAVYFRVTGPWHRTGRGGTAPAERATASEVVWWLIETLVFGALIVMGVLAAGNLLRGRADVRTAARMGLLIIGLTLAGRLAAGWHVPDPVTLIMPALGFAGGLWVVAGGLYLGLEPVVRRRWPWRLTGWVRLFDGRLRDPLVGRDILTGLAAGLLAMVIANISAAVAIALTVPGTDPAAEPFFGVVAPAAYRLLLITRAFGLPILFLSVAFVLFKVVRWEGVAWGLFFLLTVSVGLRDLTSDSLVGNVVLLVKHVVWMGLVVALLARFGLLALATMIAVESVLALSPLTTDMSAWYFTSGAAVAAAVVAVAAYCCYIAIGGRQVFREGFFGDE